MQTSLKTADLCFNSLSLLQDRVFYKSNEKRESCCHQGEIKRSKVHQSEGHHNQKQTHLMETYAEMEQHFQQLNADLLSSTKENERDMFDQRNQQFSTILVATTIMLSALVCCLAQGVLPANCQSDFIYNLYSVSTSMSVACLFICLVFCIEVMWRASKFMYKRSKCHTGYLSNAIKKTKAMMKAIRGVKDKASRHGPRERDNTHSHPHSPSRKAHVEGFRPEGLSRHISKMTSENVEREFTGYEAETGLYNTSREEMIDKSAFMVTADDGSMVESKSFERFWQEECGFYGNVAVLSFYAGSAALFFANVTFIWAVNLYRYANVLSANLVALIILGSLIISIALLIYIRHIERISMDNTQGDESEGDKYSWGSFLAGISTSGRADGQSFRRSMWSSFMGTGGQPSSSSDSSPSEEGDDDTGDKMGDNAGNSGGVSGRNVGDDLRGRGLRRTSSTRTFRDGVGSHGGGRGASASPRRQSMPRVPLPVARSLDIPLTFQGNYSDPQTFPTADAAFPILPTGMFDIGHASVLLRREQQVLW